MEKDFGKEAPFQQPTSQLNRIEGMLSCLLEWAQNVRLGAPAPAGDGRSTPAAGFAEPTSSFPPSDQPSVSPNAFLKE